MAERTFDNEIYDNHGKIEFGGAGNAYTARTARAITGYFKGLRICGKANHSNTGPATLNVNAYGGFSIRLPGNDPLAGGEILSGGYYDFIYDETNGVFQIQNPSGTTVTTAQLADNSVTYAKMQNVSATARVLGRKTAGAGDPEECTLSEVLDFIGSAAQGDILYRGASSWARLPAGTNGQFLKTQGAGANPQWASQLVQAVAQGSISSVAQLDISLGTADMYEIDLINFRPETDATHLYMRFSQGGTFLSGASDYKWEVQKTGLQQIDTADAQIRLADDIGNDSPQQEATVTVRIFRPSDTTERKIAHWYGHKTSPATNFESLIGAGQLPANTGAVDGARIFFSSGNAASGHYAVRSYSFT